LKLFLNVLNTSELAFIKLNRGKKSEVHETVAHDDFKKKATDPKWYKKAFLTFKTSQPGLTYAASYKVSNRLLAR
jgi:hypothetical protein